MSPAAAVGGSLLAVGPYRLRNNFVPTRERVRARYPTACSSSCRLGRGGWGCRVANTTIRVESMLCLKHREMNVSSAAPVYLSAISGASIASSWSVFRRRTASNRRPSASPPGATYDGDSMPFSWRQVVRAAPNPIRRADDHPSPAGGRWTICLLAPKTRGVRHPAGTSVCTECVGKRRSA
jgi:hypothetical protein